jgi:hypothetical protein
MLKVILENIFSLSLQKTAIKDFNINEAMTKQIILTKVNNRNHSRLGMLNKVSEHSNGICVMLVEQVRMNYRR